MKLKDWRIVAELIRFLIGNPVKQMVQRVLVGVLCVLMPWKAVAAGPIWRIRRLWRLSPRGSDRWYRCQRCGRLCHIDATAGRYGALEGDPRKVVGECRRCVESS